MNNSIPFVLPFGVIAAADLPLVGGKGANLGEMRRAGFPVPPGFCVTTEAFRCFMALNPEPGALYALLGTLSGDDIAAARQVGQQVRAMLQSVLMPEEVAQAISTAWREEGCDHTYAVRSSATAEDLPDASFAGQQDTYLNIRGETELLESVKRCWISLFTDRAILYRIQNGFDHREVALSVVIQRMVLPEISGILFTADPVSGHRHIASIDASYGLGEALVAGLVSADLYRVDKRTRQLVTVQVADKQLAIRPLPEGGTYQEKLSDEARQAQVLTGAQAIALAQIGQRIEQHYGQPQDIEWALANGDIYIVQSRPITALYPLPQPGPTEDALQVYFSFSHAQVMTDPMRPLAISVWRLLFPFGKRSEPMAMNPYLAAAAGRIYANLSPMLRLAPTRHLLPRFLTFADALSSQSIREVADRTEFRQSKGQRTKGRDLLWWVGPLLVKALARLFWQRPETAVPDLARITDEYLVKVQKELAAAPTTLERLRLAQRLIGTVFIEAALPMPPYLMAGMMAKILLERMSERQGTMDDVAALARGLSGNVTTEMDLMVGDLADAARRSPALAAFLRQADSATTALAQVTHIEGGADFLVVWNKFMRLYGMRGPSEIDISRDRWREDPGSLWRMMLGNLVHGESGAHRRHHQGLMQAAEAAADRLVQAAHRGMFGGLRARWVRRLTRVFRHGMAIREHPKFMLIQFLGLVKPVILAAAAELVTANCLNKPEDIWLLTWEEMMEMVEYGGDKRPLVTQRQAEMKRYAKMTPPRVMTSDGEIPVVKHSNHNIPAGALPGNSVSAGVIEGLAKVVLDPTQETLIPGEILVAPFTDPGWTPLFINAAGLVMEVGGLMTHGSVVAREYGIPAVVGVLEATKTIRTGQRIRVHGDGGYVEILPDQVE